MTFDPLCPIIILITVKVQAVIIVQGPVKHQLSSTCPVQVSCYEIAESAFSMKADSAQHTPVQNQRTHAQLSKSYEF